MSTRLRAVPWLLAALAGPWGASCTSVLGIEELHQEPAPDGAGSSGRAGDAGAGAGGGTAGRVEGGDASRMADGSGSGQAGPDASTAGSGGAEDAGSDVRLADVLMRDVNAADGPSADVSRADATPDGGSPDALGDAGRDATPVDAVSPVDALPPPADVSDAGATILVQGHLIDAWRHDVAGAYVAIGEQFKTTDATGHFAFTNVAPPYDVRLIVNGSAVGVIGTQGWLYQGLRRPDPTLQVYVALPRGSNSVIDRIDNVTFPLPATNAILLAVGTPDGSVTFDTDTSELDYGPFLWRGPAQTAGTLHGLRVAHAGTNVLDPVTAFLGYDARPAAFDNAAPTAQVALDLTTRTIPSANISGVVASSSSDTPTNDAWLTFTSGASMHVVSETRGNGAFSYLMPTLPNATVAISASRGSFFFRPYAVAHRDGLLPGADAGTLTVPAFPGQTLPVTGATGVTAATSFGWTAPPGLSITAFAFNDVDVNYFVVTMGSSARMPAFPGTGYDLPRNAGGTWHVETHGPYATMDDAAGPTGMIDAFRGTGEYIRPPTPSRSFGLSEERAFTTAP